MDKLGVPGTSRLSHYSARRICGLLALSLLAAIPFMGAQGGCGGGSSSSAGSSESEQRLDYCRDLSLINNDRDTHCDKDDGTTVKLGDYWYSRVELALSLLTAKPLMGAQGGCGGSSSSAGSSESEQRLDYCRDLSLINNDRDTLCDKDDGTTVKLGDYWNSRVDRRSP